MPRPAKPPMTLKEAKRAYKKDGVGFQYTASQMARADRQDAQDEKRKKALDKERQRVENKRKRDEKDTRERAVKQKMLDEGRITVEDTWGKVAASQPRLNKFFGQRTAVAPAKRKIQEETVAHAETSSQTVSVVHTDKETRESPEVQPPPESAYRLTAPVFQEALGRNPAADPTSSDEGDASGLAMQTTFSTVDRESLDAAQHRDIRSPRPRLRELRPSQINARSTRSQYIQADTTCITPVRGSPALVNEQGSELDRSASARQSQTRKRDARVSAPASIFHPPENRRRALPAAKDVSPATFDEEEDFTDGIDDDTLLMLYDEQEQELHTPTTANASQSPAGLNTEKSVPVSSGETKECPSPPRQAEVSTITTNKHQDTMPLTSKGLSESFSSVFNEIDDDELIALAEKVEASMPSPSPAAPVAVATPKPPKQSAEPSRKATVRAALPQPPPRLSMPPPKRSGQVSERTTSMTSSEHISPSTEATPQPTSEVPFSRTNPKPLPRASMPPRTTRSSMPPPQTKSLPSKAQPPSPVLKQPPSPVLKQPANRRTLPWKIPSNDYYDEFDVPGPSTQAIMVELAEEAEARIQKVYK
ncbi:hypothetical protein EDD37DRAFT_612406 [Exophiala viscosa]|uniref:Uncharacterized protein n=1 Tax=Exophiala viscosa TaxID=2486360 RepID=A0AAN6DPE4_9EURO|nr:hypothetical protein EDD36DRAFT_422813 [Exophiala viscosa]KAI1620950.1 hypothetical protein EDD37DRAFT_612406 [Exophiala viscosa]